MTIAASGGAAAVDIVHAAAATTAMDVTIDGLNLNSTTGAGIGVTGANDTSGFNLKLTDGVYQNNVAMNITGPARSACSWITSTSIRRLRTRLRSR